MPESSRVLKFLFFDVFENVLVYGMEVVQDAVFYGFWEIASSLVGIWLF